MKRALIYFLYHPQGRVDAYVPKFLNELRSRFARIVVVSNGALHPGQADKLHMADKVLQRPNTGFDVAAYRAGMDEIDLAQYDELTLANFTFFPIPGAFETVFSWADALCADFWGLSAHAALTPNPFTGRGTLPYHLNSHWIAVRKPMLQSAAFADYWRDLPQIESYDQSVIFHESRFTHHFEALGFRSAAYLAPVEQGAAYPAFDDAHLHLPHGLPFVKRRMFFHTPTAYADAHGANPRACLQWIDQADVWSALADQTDPQVLYENADLLHVFPSGVASTTGPIKMYLDLPSHLSVQDIAAFEAAMTVPLDLELSGPGAPQVAAFLAGHPMLAPCAAPMDQPVLLARVLPGQGGELAHGLRHLAGDSGIAAAAVALINSPGVGAGLPPVRTHGRDCPVTEDFGARANVAWMRADLAAQAIAQNLAPAHIADLAQRSRLITVKISNTSEIARSFVKLEARHRALTQRLGTADPFEAPAKLDHLIAQSDPAEFQQARERLWREAFDAGFKAAFDAAFDEGFRDGWRKSEAGRKGWFRRRA